MSAPLVVLIWIGLFEVLLLSTLFMALAATVARVRIHEIGIGYGTKLGRFRLGPTAFRFNLIPVGTYLRLADNRFPGCADDPRVSFDSKPHWIRFAITASGAVMPAVIAALYLGQEAWPGMVSAVPEFVRGALSPRGAAQEMIGHFLENAEQQGLPWATAWILLKLGTLMLVPFSPATGIGQALMSLRNQPPSRPIEIWATLSGFVMLIAIGSWLVAAFPHLLR